MGDQVAWRSQAGGRSKEKAGVVDEVVPAGELPSRKYTHLHRQGVGLPRNHESVVVLVDGRPYWPRVTSLVRDQRSRFSQARDSWFKSNEGRAALRSATALAISLIAKHLESAFLAGFEAGQERGR